MADQSASVADLPAVATDYSALMADHHPHKLISLDLEWDCLFHYTACNIRKFPNAMTLPSAISDCCLRRFDWAGTPVGDTTSLAGTKAYKTGSSSSVAILLIHDLFGWQFVNVRLLADHYAKEIGATVYVPDL